MDKISTITLPDGTKYRLSDNDAQLIKDTVGWTGKNILDNTASSTGVFTVNADKTVNVNAVSVTANQWLLVNHFTIPRGSYKLCKCEPNDPLASDTNARLVVFKDSEWGTIAGYSSTTSCIDVEFDADTEIWVKIQILNGSTVNGILKPMICKADITDPTYEPYHESVEEEIEQVYADNGVLGAKNFLQANATSRTVNGVTFTLNDDKSFTANGTATADIYFESHIMSAKANDVYIVSDNLANPSDSTYRGKIMGKTTGNDYAFLTTGKEKKFTVTNTEKIVYSFKVKSGQTVSNITFKPMIRLTSDPDDTYVPHAMTNRELTEAMGNNVLLSWSNHYAVNDEINLSDSINNYRKLTFVMGRNSDTNGLQNIDVVIISQGIGSNTTFTRLSFYDDNATHDMIIQRISDTKLKITTSDLTSSNFGIRTIIGWK